MLLQRFNDLLTHYGNIRTRLEGTAGARELRAPGNAEGEGHPFMRPVIQKAVAGELVQQKLLTWPDVTKRPAELDWRPATPPWTAAYQVEANKMLTVKEYATRFGDLLHVHLAPTSLAEIKRARKWYRELRSQQYTVSEEDLATRIP